MATDTGSTPEHGELVEIFSSMQESESQIVKGLLESEGIEALVISREAPQDVLPGVGAIAVMVNREDADRARTLITEQESAAEEDQSVSDSDEDP